VLGHSMRCAGDLFVIRGDQTRLEISIYYKGINLCFGTSLPEKLLVFLVGEFKVLAFVF